MTVKVALSLLNSLLWGFFQNWWMIWSDPPPLTSSSPPQTSGCCQAGLQAGQLIFQQVAPWKLNSIKSCCQISGLVRQWNIRHSHAVNTFTLPWKRQERIFGQKYRNRQRIGILALRHVAFMLQAICQDVLFCVALRTWNVLTPRRWEPCDAARTEISVITEINRIICYPSLCNGSTVFKSLHLFLPSLPFLLNMEANPHPPRSFLSPVLWPRISCQSRSVSC